MGESTNDYILDLLTADGLLSKKEREDLRYTPGGDPNKASITNTENLQKAEKGEIEL